MIEISFKPTLFYVYFTYMSLFLIEQLVERYHQVDHIQTGYDFHNLFFGQDIIFITWQWVKND